MKTKVFFNYVPYKHDGEGWYVRIINGRVIYLGPFSSEKEAREKERETWEAVI